MIAQKYSARRVVGVDIDGELVRKAWLRRRTVWSRQAPLVMDFKEVEDDGSIRRKTKKRKLDHQVSSPPSQLAKNATTRTPVPDYFPASCLHMFGPLPIPPTPTATERVPDLDPVLPGPNVFPHNLTFRQSDWPSQPIPEDNEHYDVVIAYVPSLPLSSFYFSPADITTGSPCQNGST